MNILILEDESLAANKLINMLDQSGLPYKLLGVLASVEEATAWLSMHDSPDLILSDIRLLDGLSFEVFSKVDYQNPVIFTTAYDQYAIKAFEYNSLDYLLKPVQQDKLNAAINKIAIGKSSPTLDQKVLEDLMALLDNQKKNYKSRFLIKTGHKIQAISADKIAYFFSQNKISYIVDREAKKYPIDLTLEAVEEVVDPNRFFRANRQFIVSFESIHEIHPYFKGRIKINLQPQAQDELVISAEKTPDFKKWLDQ